MLIKDIAKMCHEVNKLYCEMIGDNSQLSWELAPEWQKESAINGVKFHLVNPNASASHSHDNWFKEKLSDGWIYGPVKDSLKKEHPCCIEYSNLPLKDQTKDYLFKSIVSNLTPLLTE